ncbi:substrate-binding domain-containing protein [Microbacterium sp. LMI12-1-1.1]
MDRQRDFPTTEPGISDFARSTSRNSATDILVALTELSAARRAGFTVPEDLSILPFNSAPRARASPPAMSAVLQPVRELGSTGARIVFERIQGLDDPPRKYSYKYAQPESATETILMPVCC